MTTDIKELYDEEAGAIGVTRFAGEMLCKLIEKRVEGRGGWNIPAECSLSTLKKMLKEHVDKGDMVDIGNFAMFIWNREHPKG